ncbi:MAG: polyprenol monophosphomannose synthase [Fidelibacterota bacterium]
MKTLIITPTYNERKNVGILIKRLHEIDNNFHILVVDDNSPDGTGDYIDSLRSFYSHLHLLRRPEKEGLGKAYCAGFNWALERDYEIIVQMDADMSHDPEDVPRLIGSIGNADLVIGSRYSNGVSVVNWPISRLMLSYGANLYSRIITGMPVRDATGGFKCWRREVLAAIDLGKVKSEGYSFQIEMTFRAWRKGFRVQEIPIIFIDRTVGESKMSRSIMLEAILMVWRLRLWRIFGWNK